MASLQAVTKALAILATGCPNFNVKEGMAEVWTELLADIPDEAMIGLTMEVARQCTYPAVPEFVKRYYDALDHTPLGGEAWGIALEALRKRGWRECATDPQFEAEPWSSALLAVGGWEALGYADSQAYPTLQAQFRTVWDQVAGKRRTVERMLPVTARALGVGNSIPRLRSGK